MFGLAFFWTHLQQERSYSYFQDCQTNITRDAKERKHTPKHHVPGEERRTPCDHNQQHSARGCSYSCLMHPPLHLPPVVSVHTSPTVHVHF
jgi:hypothetical protein